MLSAGCSDRSYFDWITSCLGDIDRHIGIELYLPEPADLPDNVEWVKNSVGDMSSVADGEVDLVFSGQNFEHLFDDDAPRFLLEAHRVLRAGGHLVMDSPHRDIADRTLWVHPEHTIEFTPDEARTLATLAGFDVTSLRGLWLCSDPSTGKPLDLWPWPDYQVDPLELAYRVSLAGERPDDSFVWWLEAIRSERAPDADGLLAEHRAIYSRAWRDRLQRMQRQLGDVTGSNGDRVVSAGVGQPGAMMFGPYVPLRPGHYVARWHLRRASGAVAVAPDVVVATADICDFSGHALVSRQVHAAALTEGEWTLVEQPFDIAHLTWGGQFRVFTAGLQELEARYVSDVDFPS